MDKNQENDYLCAAAQGDKKSFGILYSHYLEEIYRFVFIKIGNELTAEDITEETFIRIWESLPRYYKNNGKVKNLRALLYRVANNLVIDHYRKRRPLENIEENNPGPPPLAEKLAIDHEQSKQLVKYIRKLKPDYQQVILLRLVNNLSHKEVASIMNISEGNSRVLLFRAVKELKKMLLKKDDSYA